MSMTVEEYMSLPYQKVVTPLSDDDGGGFLTEVPLLGKYATCAWGKTQEDALNALEEVMRGNITSWIDEGIEIPVPENKKKYAGNISLRLPPYFHKTLAELADAEGVSMNSLVNNLISLALGMRSPDAVEHYHFHTHQFMPESMPETPRMMDRYNEERESLFGKAC